jgi:hypothetical protein
MKNDAASQYCAHSIFIYLFKNRSIVNENKTISETDNAGAGNTGQKTSTNMYPVSIDTDDTLSDVIGMESDKVSSLQMTKQKQKICHCYI